MRDVCDEIALRETFKRLRSQPGMGELLTALENDHGLYLGPGRARPATRQINRQRLTGRLAKELKISRADAAELLDEARKILTAESQCNTLMRIGFEDCSATPQKTAV